MDDPQVQVDPMAVIRELQVMLSDAHLQNAMLRARNSQLESAAQSDD